MKNVFISGMSRGIGLEIFKQLSDSFNVSGSTSNLKLVPNLFEAMKLKNSELLEIDAHLLNKPDKFDSYLSRIPGNVDILINNAGIAKFQDFLDTNLLTLTEHLNVNLYLSYLLTKAVLPSMLEKKSGLIINILSVASIKPFIGASLYSAAKAAMSAMFDSIREEVRSEGVKITNIYLGATETTIWSEEMREKYSEKMIDPLDVADTVVALIELSKRKRMMIEEIVLRPQFGDL
jgi:3-oxoacyl-[acyl-carrier protein] reductase